MFFRGSIPLFVYFVEAKDHRYEEVDFKALYWESKLSVYSATLWGGLSAVSHIGLRTVFESLLPPPLPETVTISVSLSKHQIRKQQVRKFLSWLASLAARVCTTMVVHPFAVTTVWEVARSIDSEVKPGVVQTFRDVYDKKCLWNGLSAGVLYDGIVYTLSSSVKTLLPKQNGYNKGADKLSLEERWRRFCWVSFLRQQADLAIYVVLHPLNKIRVRLIADGCLPFAKQYNGILDCGKQIFSRNGLIGLYSGVETYLYSFVGELVFSVLVYGVGHGLVACTAEEDISAEPNASFDYVFGLAETLDFTI